MLQGIHHYRLAPNTFLRHHIS